MAKKTSPVKTAVKKPLPAPGGSMIRKQKAKDKTPRLSTGLKRQVKIQQALYEIADAASEATDMQSFYKRLHKIVGGLMYADNFIVQVYDETKKTVTYPYVVDISGILKPLFDPIPVEKIRKGLAMYVLQTGKTLHVSKEESARMIKERIIQRIGRLDEDDWLGVPLLTEGRAIGVIAVQTPPGGGHYTDDNAHVLEFVAQHIAVALTRARAIEETRQRNSELAIINSVQAALAAQLDIHGIYEAVGEKLREIFSYQDVTIYTGDLRSRIMTVEYSYELGEKSERRSVPMNSLYEYFVTSNKTFVFNGDIPSFTAKFSDYQNPEPPKSLLAVPVRRNKDTEPVVYLTIQDWSGKKFFSDSDVRLMETLANSMSVALENARLFDETQRLLKETEQRAAELAIINSVQEGLASKLEIQAIYELIGEKVREVFNVQVADIVVYDPMTNLISMPYSYEKGDRSVIAPQEPYGFRLEVIKNRAPLLINQNFAELASRHSNPLLTGEWPKSAMFIPLLIDDNVKGIISIQDVDRENAYNASDVRLLQTLANAMSVALENARLFDETQRLLKETEDRAAELAIINSVQEGLASNLDMRGIYDLVGDKVREIFDANTVVLATFDLDKKLMRPHYAIEKGERFYIEPTPIPTVWMDFIQRGQPLLINNNLLEYVQRFDPNIKPLAGKIPRSALAVPLAMHGELRGAISLQNIDREYAFSESDMRLLQTLANSMSVALENARLWEQEHLYRQALEREFEIGREIQMGFLPEDLPQPDGWEIAASLKSAREVAGDFYDVFELPGDKIGLVIGDVCDKGLGAALFMTLFRSLLRAASNLDFFARVESNNENSAARLKNAISLTNNYIVETHGDTGMFATIFFGILDTRTGLLTYINGGHLPPMLVNAQGVKETLRFTGPAVGAMADTDYVIKEALIEPGESFFAYTDGLTDTENPAGESFNEKDLIPLLLDDQPLSPLLAELQKRAADYAAGAKQYDDITLLAARRL